MLFRGQLQPLAGHVERDVPKGLARLGTMLDRLEAYVRMAPPTTPEQAPPPSSASDDDDPAKAWAREEREEDDA